MRVPVAVLAAVLAFGSGPAWAQMDSREAIQLQNEILGLRRDMQALQQNQGGGGYAPQQSAPSGDSGGGGLEAQLLDRVATLEDQVRSLRGQVDSLTNQLQRQNADLSKQISDMQFQLQNGGGGGGGGAPAPRGAPPAQSPPQGSLGGGNERAAAAPPAAPPPRTPEVAMQEGNAALARRDYPAAEAAAREVLAKKGAPHAVDAQFLLSQAELGQRNYQQAAPGFYDAYNRARTGPHAADALLGVADSLIGLGDKNSACEALAKMRAEFPQPRPDVRAHEAAARQRAGCH